LSRLKRVVWGIIGGLLAILGIALLPLPGPGFPFLVLGLLILIAVEMPYVEEWFYKMIDWAERKTGWTIHSRVRKVGSCLKYLGLKLKRRKKKKENPP
jgi:hypothetical protein